MIMKNVRLTTETTKSRLFGDFIEIVAKFYEGDVIVARDAAEMDIFFKIDENGFYRETEQAKRFKIGKTSDSYTFSFFNLEALDDIMAEFVKRGYQVSHSHKVN